MCWCRYLVSSQCNQNENQTLATKCSSVSTAHRANKCQEPISWISEPVDTVLIYIPCWKDACRCSYLRQIYKFHQFTYWFYSKGCRVLPPELLLLQVQLQLLQLVVISICGHFWVQNQAPKNKFKTKSEKCKQFYCKAHAKALC